MLLSACGGGGGGDDGGAGGGGGAAATGGGASGGSPSGGQGAPPPAASGNADLAALTLGRATLDQTFDAARTGYTATVGFLIDSIDVDAIAADADARLRINGANVSAATIPLAEGNNDVAIEVTAENGATTRSYSVTVTRQSAAAFAQDAYIKASNTDALDRFNIVALDGNTLAVGAPSEDGASAGIGGNEADDSAPDAGAVYVFTRDAVGDWSQQAYLKASNSEPGDQFGWSVALAGDTLAVGAISESSAANGVNGSQADNSAPAAGAVYVFTRNAAGVWSQQAYLKASNAEAVDNFGYAVALSADTLAVSAPFEDGAAGGVNGNQATNSAADSGAVYVFTRGAGIWSQQAYVKASNTEADDFFGFDVALDRDTLAVGASSEDGASTGINGNQTGPTSNNSGAVYVFKRESGIWAQQAYIKASNAGEGDAFGSDVALSGDTLAVGADPEASAAKGINGNQADNSAPNAGAVYVFARAAGAWSQQAYIKASNTGAGDAFGLSIALAGDALAVGARSEDSASTGVNGNQNDESVPGAGAVYVFRRDAAGTWVQRAYLKSSDPGRADGFGYSVALAGDTVAVGVFSDDSAATGVNGDATDNSASGAGAVHVFGGRPSREVSLTSLAIDGADLDQIFQASQLHYTAGVGFLHSAARLDVRPANSGARVRVNGVAVAEGRFDVALAEGSNRIEIEVTGEDGVTERAYTLTITREFAASFAQAAYVKASNTGAGDVFGHSVALAGDTLAIGAFGESSAATGVNGDSANDSANAAGAVYVFVRDGSGGWSQQAYIKGSNTEADDRFGIDVALSGDTLAVGAYFEDSAATGVNDNQGDNSAPDAGAVYVFTRNAAGDWSQQAYIKASNTEAGDLFGYSLALAADTLAVGAYLEASASPGIDGNGSDNGAPQSGAVYVFTRDASGVWSQQAYVKASNPEIGDQFGVAVALDGDTLAVGASSEDGTASGVNGNQASNGAVDSGAVYVFKRDGADHWSQEAYIKASNTETADYFGSSVALSGNTLAVGAPEEDSVAIGVNGNQANNSTSSAGAVYVFARNTASVWSQQAYIKASNTEADDHFGFALAVAGDTLAVGAHLEASAAPGINGSQGDNSAPRAGAVYVFGRNGAGGWAQRAYVKASNPNSDDVFGGAVALASDALAVGAYLEDSVAVGVDGNQASNGANSAGAAYVFD